MDEYGIIGMQFATLVRGQRECRRQIRKLGCEWKQKDFYVGEMLAEAGRGTCAWESRTGFQQPSNEEECCDNCFASLLPRLQLKQFQHSMTRLKRSIKG